MNQKLNADKLQLNTEIELLITVPEGKVLDKLMVNEEDKKTAVVENKFKVVVTKDLTISVTFKDKVKTMKLDLPEGISLVDKNLDANNLQLNTENELLITIPEGKVIDNDLMYFTDSFSEVSSFEVKVKLFTTAEGGLSTSLDVNSALNVYVWQHDINATVTRITDLEGNTVDEALPGETYVMKIKLGVGDRHIFYQSQSLAFRIGGQTFMKGTVL